MCRGGAKFLPRACERARDRGRRDREGRKGPCSDRAFDRAGGGEAARRTALARREAARAGRDFFRSKGAAPRGRYRPVACGRRIRLDDEKITPEITKMSDKKPRKLTPAAERALAEAEARRAAAKKVDLQKESPPRKDPEPTRYGDWEKKGITSDFS